MKYTIQELLSSTSHRPWELPLEQWFWYQEWNDAIFLHYKVEEKILRKYVPNYLELDLINHSAWVSVVAFTMNKVHIRNFFQIDSISNFHEVNLRTYVTYNGKPGVYFLSIEAEKIIPTILANLLSGLLYKYSSITRKPNYYQLIGKRSQISFEFLVKDKISEKSNLDFALTERYCLYKNSPNHMKRLEIQHKPWELFRIEFTKLEIDYFQYSPSIDFNNPDLIHYSPGIQVVAWT
jgi:uncharacterized protein YqjF (DUF2071 family)